jgi:hypothetical protein
MFLVPSRRRNSIRTEEERVRDGAGRATVRVLSAPRPRARRRRENAFYGKGRPVARRRGRSGGVRFVGPSFRIPSIVAAGSAIGAGSGTELRLALLQVAAQRRRRARPALGAGGSRRAVFTSVPLLRIVHRREGARGRRLRQPTLSGALPTWHRRVGQRMAPAFRIEPSPLSCRCPGCARRCPDVRKCRPVRSA